MPSKKNKPSRKLKLKKSKKMWSMRGCAHSAKHRCSKCKHSKRCQCAVCKKCMKGGSSFYKPASPIPGPFVGQPWGPSVHEWPSENGMGADRNYLSQNMYFKDPQTMMIVGGKKAKSKTYKKKRGGGLIPQSLTNLGRSISFNAGSIYNTLNGYSPPVNPAPYAQQLPNATKQLLI